MDKKTQNVNQEVFPHMEWYFDEIEDEYSFKCPVTGRKVTVNFIRRADVDNTPYVEVEHCSLLGDHPPCAQKCISLINHLQHIKRQEG